MPFSYTVKAGDTANAIANRYGFANYKEAGISTPASGNFDLIKEGETLNLGNYNPNNVQGFKSTPPIISSQDNKAEYMQNSTKLDGILGAFKGITPEVTTEKKTTVTPTKETVTTETDVTGDPLYDRLSKEAKAKEDALNADALLKKAERESLYQTDLANLDEQTASRINSINLTYDKLDAQQARINKLNTDRTLAYGLANGGQYTPMDFTGAVSTIEQEGADKMAKLNNERNQLINEAKVARNKGASMLLKEKLDQLDKVDTNIRTTLSDVNTRLNSTYTAMRKVIDEQEKKQKAVRLETISKISGIAPRYKDDYDKMTPEQKTKFIEEVALQTGIDFASAYSALEAGMLKGAKDKLGLQKDELAVKTAWNKANTAPKTPATKKATPEQMSLDAPETFANAQEFADKQTAFIRRYGSAGATQWDKIYKKDKYGDYTYTITKTSTPKGTSGKTKSGIGYTVIN